MKICIHSKYKEKKVVSKPNNSVKELLVCIGQEAGRPHNWSGNEDNMSSFGRK
jgi:hypothetical protein